MAYEVPPLPYDYNALEPHIDEQTMRLHHDKHHQAYVTAANAALEGTEWASKPVEEALQSLSQLPQDKQAAVRNQAGGHYNHSLFWEWMSPDGGGEPEGDLAAAIESAFGSFDDFKTKFKEAGVNQFG
ncbi:MAG: superoxide dismutase, partial [Solirubrobacterales bacterium]|nr:superoxide dismutase [Solirubrobacterales bacterium]